MKRGGGRLPDVKTKGAATKTIDRPAELPEGAVAVWDKLAPYLAIAGRLQPEDFVQLERLCRAFSLYRTIQLDIETSETEVKLNNGVKAIKPAYKALEIIDAQIERLSRHFGLSPATRGALKATNHDQEQEEFDDFLASRPTT